MHLELYRCFCWLSFKARYNKILLMPPFWHQLIGPVLLVLRTSWNKDRERISYISLEYALISREFRFTHCKAEMHENYSTAGKFKMCLLHTLHSQWEHVTDVDMLTWESSYVMLSVSWADDNRVMERPASDVWHQVHQTRRLPGQPEPRNADISRAARHLVCRGI